MPSKSVVSDDDLFNRTLATFKKHLANQFRERADNFRKRYVELVWEKERKTRELDAKLGGQSVINRIHLRYSLYDADAQEVGKDFIAAFAEIVRPYCRAISDYAKTTLFKIFIDQYLRVIAQETSNLRQIAASEGRLDAYKDLGETTKAHYLNVHTTYQDMLDVEIGKHNLEVELRQEAIPDRQPQRISESNEHIPKHKIVKVGVSKMLESLRLGRPEATLDEAKRVYADQVGDSYANVNKAYHYKGKK